ncbi:formylglycine-generating enzyme family protein [Pinirhizobacter sp.]|jgi:formylglycine-generating enzyme required for sulfatase activity|uniref:formylglycine-generating enzyme family protein n=1 Tax=Pinirhizobacter sp. TaxID=2950432 RepID=UPI002F420D6B
MQALDTPGQPDVPHGFRHWPVFAGYLSADASDRELMGMSARDAATARITRPSTWSRLAVMSPDQWIAVVEGIEYDIDERILAGNLLAMTGDRRVDPLVPVVQPVAGAEIVIGLEGTAGEVLRKYPGLGLRPEWIEKERPAHRVPLGDYRIGRYPVSHGQYAAFVADTGHQGIPTAWPQGRMPDLLSNHPVHTVTYDDAVAYTRWLGTATGQPWRLPTEAEWEYAARGPDGYEFPWGDDFLPDHANTVESGLFASTPVGAFSRGTSPFGCLDMAGNVEEWVSGVYAPYPQGQHVEDDLATCPWTNHVARGGSFTRYRDLARTRRRHGRFARDIYVMGFRVAIDGLG